MGPFPHISLMFLKKYEVVKKKKRKKETRSVIALNQISSDKDQGASSKDQ